MRREYLQVFVSSVMTEEDLRSERERACAAIESLELTVPWAFETAPAEPNLATDVYLREVDNSDLLVAIVSNSHTEPVQRELERAEAANKPILAFVRRTDPGEQTEGRTKVIRWLQERCKYREYTDLDDLEQAVRDSVAAELVRGYRTYQLAREDFRRLVDRVEAPPGLVVRGPMAHELSEVREVLSELQAWYPEIGGWISKTLDEYELGHSALRIADIQGEIAGVAFSRDKDSHVRKFSTIYVRPTHQGEAIGPHLVYEEVTRAAADGVRKAYVTFADELADVLGAMLSRYGFVAEGISAGRYRPDSGEWVYGKTFYHGTIAAAEFQEVMERLLVTQAGGVVITRADHILTVRLPRMDLFGLGVSRSLLLAFSTRQSPEADYEAIREDVGEAPWLFVSMYGKPADGTHWSHAVENWIDGQDLAARFYPVEFATDDLPALVVTIKPAFADALIPRREAPTLFAPDRLQIRPDNVYYRAPDRWQTLRRGSPLLFYTSAPDMRVRGIARITSLRVDSPDECLARYGNMGLFQLADLDGIASKHGGNVLALAFDWYREIPGGVPLARVKAALGAYNPVGAKLINCADVDAILGEA